MRLWAVFQPGIDSIELPKNHEKYEALSLGQYIRTAFMTSLKTRNQEIRDRPFIF